MGTQYSHLTLEERCRLRGLMEIGLGVSEIARRLGRHRGTIHREVGRNRCVDGYRPDSAARRAWARKLRGSRIMRSTRLRTHVEGRLAMLSRVRKRSSESFSRRRVPGAEPVPAQAGIAGRMELADGTGGSGAQGVGRVHLPPCLQPDRAARRPSAPACAAQGEARSAAAQRQARAVDPEPHIHPSEAHEGASAQPVRALGGRSGPLPPPARHPPDAAGKEDAVDARAAFVGQSVHWTARLSSSLSAKMRS